MTADILVTQHEPFGDFQQDTLNAATCSGPSKRRESADEAGKQQRKHRRKQYIACDACRLRRVRCERDGEREACRGCLRRGFHCTRDYNDHKSLDSRPGRLLVQAQALYGAPTPQSSDSHVDVPQTESNSISPILIREDPPLFAYDSPEGRLNFVQSNEFVANNLLHCYSDNLCGQNPLMNDFDAFLRRFEQAGRRFHELDVTDQATSSLIMALAARISDVPLIAGASAPDTRRIRDGSWASTGTDMVAFGHRRDSVCRQLEARARSSMEQHFFKRQATVESIRALVAMQGIEDIDDPRNESSAPRIYSAIAVEQVRQIVNKVTKTPDELLMLHGQLVRSLIFTDSLWGFNSGRSLQLSDDDLVLLHPQAMHLKTAEHIRELVKSNSVPPDEPLFALTDQMIVMARTIRRRSTGPLARLSNTPPHPTFFESLQRDLTILLEANELLAPQLRVLEANRPRGAPGPKVRATYACHLGLTSFITWLLNRCERAVYETVDPTQRARLQLCRDSILPPAHRALIRMSRICKAIFEEGDLIGNNLLWTALSEAALHFCSVPTNVEGGESDFGIDEKVSGVQHFILCLQELAWSWPISGRALPELELRLAALKTSQPATDPYLTDTSLLTPSYGSWGSSISEIPSTVTDLDWLLPSDDGLIDLTPLLTASIRT